jgi:hypothetical protein
VDLGHPPFPSPWTGKGQPHTLTSSFLEQEGSHSPGLWGQTLPTIFPPCHFRLSRGLLFLLCTFSSPPSFLFQLSSLLPWLPSLSSYPLERALSFWAFYPSPYPASFVLSLVCPPPSQALLSLKLLLPRFGRKLTETSPVSSLPLHPDTQKGTEAPDGLVLTEGSGRLSPIEAPAGPSSWSKLLLTQLAEEQGAEPAPQHKASSPAQPTPACPRSGGSGEGMPAS